MNEYEETILMHDESKEFRRQFLELVSISKQMKKQIIMFENGRIIGTDETCSSLSIIYYDEEKYNLFKLYHYTGIRLTFILNELLSYLKENDITNANFHIDRFGVYSPSSHLPSLEKFENIICGMFQRCSYYMATADHTVVDYNIREEESFNSLLGQKKKDGSTLYKLDDRYFMSTFSSIHPVTKTDKMLLNIYDYHNGYDFLSKFTIIKKNCMIDEFIRYRKI